jgi:hypothetical protein
MNQSTRVAPPNALVFIEDSNGGKIPDSMGRSLIATTDSCVAVGCRAEDDGETEINLGDYRDLGVGKDLVFDGVLSTPSRKLAVRTVLGQTLLEVDVAGKTTRLLVWVSDLAEPDHIDIGLA